VERFRDFDWQSTRARFAGRDIIEQAGEGLYQLAHNEEACIFLDDDNLCAIHKELGPDAKPVTCKHFPYNLTGTPEGVVVSLDFACPTVVADEGAPIDSYAADVSLRIKEWREVAADPSRGVADVASRVAERQIEASKNVPLAWADYLAVEGAILRIMQDDDETLTERLRLVDALTREAAGRAAKGGMSGWVDSLAEAGWAPLRTPSAKVSPLAQRALLAPIVASIEDGWGGPGAVNNSSGARLRLVVALTASSSAVPLPTADGAMLNLPRMLRTRFAQDDAQLNAPIARFVTAFIARKGLLKGTTLLQGSRSLALYFAVIRWYSVACAVLAGRDIVEPGDVRYALILIEKTLSRSPARSVARFTTLVNFLFARIGSVRSLYSSTYPK